MDTIFGLGDRIKTQRIKRRLSQQQLASRLSITQSTVSSYEADQALPSIDILSQMAVIFDCTTDYLLGLDNRRFVCTDKLTKRQEEALTNLIESIVLQGTKY